MTWGEVLMTDGSRAQLRLNERGELDLAEPWSTIRLLSGQELLVPTEVSQRQGDVFLLPLSLQDLGLELEPSPDTTIIPIIAEELEVRRRQVETGRVSVVTRLHSQMASIDEMLLKETVDVERVKLEVEVPGPLPIRQEDDLVIIPVVEEVLVVQKRYVLREEIRVRRQRSEVPHHSEVILRRQSAEVVKEPVAPPATTPDP